MAQQKELAVQHIAIDLGGRESHVCIRKEDGTIVEQRRVLTERLERVLERASGSRVLMETSAEAFAIADLAKVGGHEVRVVPATLVKALGVGARRIKTDRRDAEVLSEVSCRIDVPSVHVPSEQSRQRKSMVGSREALVQARTSLVNNVRGWLRTKLIKVASGATKTFPERVRTRLEEHPDGIPEFVERLLVVIEALSEQIAAATDELELLAKGDDTCKLLMTAPGVGAVTSTSYTAALDDISRFSNAHAVESYLGLTPGEDSSGQRKRRTAISKAGSTRTRYLLLQAAWAWWRSRPQEPAVLWAKQVEHRRGRKIAIVALARKLAGILFAMWRTQTPYNPASAAAAPMT
jgi:transposase